MTRAEYEALSRDSLVDLCLGKDAIIAQLREQLRNQRRPLRAEDALEVREKGPTNLFSIERVGTLRLTTTGQLAVGMRSICASTASADLGMVLAEDLGGKTVIRAQLSLHASWVAHQRHFHATQLAELRESDGWCVVIHCFRADATNSSVWQQSKLMTTMASSAYVTVALGDVATQPFWECVSTTSTLADLQRLKDSSGAPSLVYILR